MKGKRMSLTIYGQPDCGPCKSVTRKLDKENVSYDYVDITQNAAARARLRTAGMEQTPVAQTPTEIFPATDVARLNTAIEQVRSQDVSLNTPVTSPDVGPSR